MKILNHTLKIGNPLFKVAEISANHNGSLDLAKKTIEAAKTSGADAVKLQTYTADTITINSDNEEFILKGGTWDGKKLYDLYNSAHTPFEWHQELFDHAKKLNITCFSSPFDKTAVDLLESLNCPAYKIASFEIVDHPLIEEVAKTGKPILISTGAASEYEIKQAIDLAMSFATKEVLLFHCISAYPALLQESNLNTIKYLQNKFDVDIGLSDHTIGFEASLIAASLGAVAVEKHFTLDRKNGGPDSSFSIEPNEFKEMSKLLDNTVKALGNISLKRSKSENQSRSIRKSIYFINNLKKGSKITNEDVKVIRPGNGLHPKYLRKIIGKKVSKDILFGDPATYENIQIQKNFLETKQNRFNFYFEEILKNKENFDVLYELLKKREHYISHEKMPSIEQHIEFVKNNPYRYWFFVKTENSIIGTVYIKDDNSIGINLDFKIVKFKFSEFLIELKKFVQPKNEIKSKIFKDFSVNVSKSNIDLQNWISKSGFKINFVGYNLS